MKKNVNHTFAICAYQESPYLEECIRSIMNQHWLGDVIMTTSTPSDFLHNLAKQYNIPLYIRNGQPNIKEDWNYAYDCAKTQWVTVAHQDDVYSPDYVRSLMKALEKYKDAIAFTTDYRPYIGNRVVEGNANCRIRHFLRSPLKSRILSGSTWWKKHILALGNSICCPTVSYNKERLGEHFFTSELCYNIDWDTFLKLGDIKGQFAYFDAPLVYYRISEEATSSDFIKNHKRELDDVAMFQKFWPDWIVRILMKFYTKAYTIYNEGE
ncbi:MAG: glycosyltransferase [Lachnospiraceae bacterium]|nr:glycosyltransferase [Lachnospiraceae bacterium]